MTPAELRSIRKRFGLTQSAWGAYLGIGKEYVSQIENGVRVPSATLVALIRCYDRNGFPTPHTTQEAENGTNKARGHG